MSVSSTTAAVVATPTTSLSSSGGSIGRSSSPNPTDDAFHDRLASMLDPKRANKVLEKREVQERREQQREQKKHKKTKHTSLKVVAPTLLASLAAIPSPITSPTTSPPPPMSPGSPSVTNTGASLAKVFHQSARGGGAEALERELQEKRAARSKVFGVPLEQLLLKEKTHIVNICRRDGDSTSLALNSSPSLIEQQQQGQGATTTTSGGSRGVSSVSSAQLESNSGELENLKDQREKEQGLRCPIPFIVFLTVEYIRNHGISISRYQTPRTLVISRDLSLLHRDRD